MHSCNISLLIETICKSRYPIATNRSAKVGHLLHFNLNKMIIQSKLCRWSTAYFKCLSLNIPPPVKTRLEYPIPQNYFGITPGWLKALLRQLENTQTVPFKVLWDRWIGACLQHNTLIQILCLGGFADPFAIPWLQFVALCAAHLTEVYKNNVNFRFLKSDDNVTEFNNKHDFNL